MESSQAVPLDLDALRKQMNENHRWRRGEVGGLRNDPLTLLDDAKADVDALLDHVASLQKRVPTPQEAEALRLAITEFEEAADALPEHSDHYNDRADRLRALVLRNTTPQEEGEERAAPADAPRLPGGDDAR